jgi:hypothetical protein
VNPPFTEIPNDVPDKLEVIFGFWIAGVDIGKAFTGHFLSGVSGFLVPEADYIADGHTLAVECIDAALVFLIKVLRLIVEAVEFFHLVEGKADAFITHATKIIHERRAFQTIHPAIREETMRSNSIVFLNII